MTAFDAYIRTERETMANPERFEASLGSWKGWEWETELHVLMSKRHFVLQGESTTVCGREIPSHAGTSQGRDVCKICKRWGDKTLEKVSWSNAQLKEEY